MLKEVMESTHTAQQEVSFSIGQVGIKSEVVNIEHEVCVNHGDTTLYLTRKY